MHRSRLPVGALGAVLIWSAAGCQPEGPLALAALPGHTLDPSTQPQWAAAKVKPPAKSARKRPPPRKPTMTAEEKKWHVPAARNWRHIVIHHSATPAGNAVAFDISHRARGLDELGYHFVINNGSGGPDGGVEVGARWRKQKWGAHCGGTPNNEYNNEGIGVCLVGDFRRHLPSPAQLASLERLVIFLTRTYQIAPENVLGHCNCPNAATECPGERLLRHLEASLLPKIARSLAAKQ